jgi:hygromycin-B 7''-O-kinase
VAGWRAAIEIIAERHGLGSSELAPCEQGEAIVWQAGNHVIKLTAPPCAYQIEAEVGCLGAAHGKLNVETPRLVAHGELSGWPYVVMGRLAGRPLADFWPELEHRERCRLARSVGRLSSELHALPPAGFPPDWHTFFRTHNASPRARHAAQGGPPALLDAIEPFLQRVMPSDPGPLVPLHTELSEMHVYAEERRGKLELSGLLDFADARLGPAEYETSCPVEFLFRSEPSLLREFLLGAGIPEARLDASYSETLLAWALCHRFSSLSRLLSRVEPWVPERLEELAVRLFSVAELT